MRKSQNPIHNFYGYFNLVYTSLYLYLCLSPSVWALIWRWNICFLEFVVFVSEERCRFSSYYNIHFVFSAFIPVRTLLCPIHICIYYFVGAMLPGSFCLVHCFLFLLSFPECVRMSDFSLLSLLLPLHLLPIFFSFLHCFFIIFFLHLSHGFVFIRLCCLCLQ